MSVLSLYVQQIPEAVAMWRLQIKRSRVRFPHWNFFFCLIFFSLSFFFMLAPPFQCSSIFLVSSECHDVFFSSQGVSVKQLKITVPCASVLLAYTVIVEIFVVV